MTNPAPQSNRFHRAAQAAVAIVAALSIVVIEHARMIPGYEPDGGLVAVAALACPAFAAVAWFTARFRRYRSALQGLLCAAAFAPVFELVFQWFSGRTLPTLEKNLLMAIESLIVSSCLFLDSRSARRRTVALCGIIAIMSFASIAEMTSPPYYAMSVLILAVPVWLFIEHEAEKPERHDLIDPCVDLERQRLRKRGVFIRLGVVSILGIIGFTQVRGDNAVNRVLAEWVGSSGGTGEANELATAGVNDGPNEVSASQNADSVGFTDSEIYLETDRPSLFDAFNEQYGEPFKPKKHERMQAMGPQNVKESGERPRENLQAGRTFETNRRIPQANRKPSDRPAVALAYVKGKAGTRLKLATFDRFDGQDWSEEADCTDPCRFIVESDGKGDCWFCLHLPWPDGFAETVDHKVKIAALDSSVLPSPANLSKYKVGGLREVTMFGWAGRDVVRMVDRTIPAGTTMETRSRRVSRRHLFETDFEGFRLHSLHHRHFHDQSDFALSPAVRALVTSWNLGEKNSWVQVERLLEALKNHARLHETEGTPEPGPEGVADAADMIERFLVRDRQGPDYLFASAAAVILRDLGYPCRLASGLYVDPESYDSSKAHYVLNSKHLHFWVELLTPQNVWVPIDPSPGYEAEFARESWFDLAVIQAWFLWDRISRHRLPIGLAMAFVMAMIAVRKLIYDKVVMLYLCHGPFGDERIRVLTTLRHMEWRLSRHLGQRPEQRSLRNHWSALGRPPYELQSLLRLGEWAAYAPADRSPPLHSNDIRNLCRVAARNWHGTEMKTWFNGNRDIA